MIETRRLFGGSWDLLGPPPPSAPGFGDVAVDVDMDADEEERWYRESLGDQGMVDGFCGQLRDGRGRVIAGDVPRRRNGQRARVFNDLDTETAERQQDSRARVLLSMHRQRLISDAHCRAELQTIGYAMGEDWCPQPAMIAPLPTAPPAGRRSAAVVPLRRVAPPVLMPATEPRGERLMAFAWAVSWRLGLAGVVGLVLLGAMAPYVARPAAWAVLLGLMAAGTVLWRRRGLLGGLWRVLVAAEAMALTLGHAVPFVTAVVATTALCLGEAILRVRAR